MKKTILFLLLLSVAFTSCYYDDEETLYTCTVDASAIRYSTTIVAILDSYGCRSCHAGATAPGGVNLQTYTTIKTVADNGRLFGAINHSAGFSPMPQGGAKMSDCDIKKVKAWIDAGAPNN